MVEHKTAPKITVIGLGGGGGNAVNTMYNSETMSYVKFINANTDAQALMHSPVEYKIQLGLKTNKGLGAGADPFVGAKAAEESIDEIREAIKGSDMLFIAIGAGGGTGSGAAHVVAALSKEMGILTVSVVTTPFNFEGSARQSVAKRAIQDLKKHCETVIIIHNQNLLAIANTSTKLQDAFKGVDDVLFISVRSIVDLVVTPGMINCDFADIETTMKVKGRAVMGIGQATGENRALRAAQAAINNPLLDHSSIQDAKCLLINITGGDDLKLYEVDEAINEIKKAIRNDAVKVIFGTVFEKNADYIRISLVATGITDQVTESLHFNNVLQKNMFSESAEEKNSAYINPLWGNAVKSNEDRQQETKSTSNPTSFTSEASSTSRKSFDKTEEAFVYDNEDGLPPFLKTRR